MDWIDLLRVLVLVGLIRGAWQGWKALPPPTFIRGKRCYKQADGSYRTLFGRRIEEPTDKNRFAAGRSAPVVQQETRTEPPGKDQSK